MKTFRASFRNLNEADKWLFKIKESYPNNIIYTEVGRPRDGGDGYLDYQCHVYEELLREPSALGREISSKEDQRGDTATRPEGGLPGDDRLRFDP